MKLIRLFCYISCTIIGNTVSRVAHNNIITFSSSQFDWHSTCNIFFLSLIRRMIMILFISLMMCWVSSYIFLVVLHLIKKKITALSPTYSLFLYSSSLSQRALTEIFFFIHTESRRNQNWRYFRSLIERPNVMWAVSLTNSIQLIVLWRIKNAT